MTTDNDKNIKELELGQDTNVKNESTGEVVTGDKPTNSFYDGGSKKESDTKWTEDWRGKSLFLFLAFLIVMAVTIPSGMALAGYFEDRDGHYTLSSEEQDKEVKKDIEYIKNEAVTNRFEQMMNEGWFTEKYYNNQVDKIENDVDDQIANEKDAMKSQYGNTWETEWNDSLIEKGFNDEEAYKTSLLADKYVSIESSKYSSASYFRNKTAKIDYADNEFVSHNKDGSEFDSSASTDSVYFINNDDTLKAALKTPDFYKGNILSPEDLVKLYVYTYEPIALNSSILTFTPQKGEEASIAANNVSLTTDDLKLMRDFQKVSDTAYIPNTIVDGGIKSKYDLNVSTAADAAINAAFGATDYVGTNMEIDPADTTKTIFEGVITKDTTDAEIDAMISTEIETAEKNFATNLGAAGYTASGTNKRNYVNVVTNIVTDSSAHSLGKDYVTYLDVDGIHIYGLQDAATAKLEDSKIVMTDDTMIINYLDRLNKISDYENIADTGFFSSYSTWLSTNFETIIGFDYVLNNFNDNLMTTEEGSASTDEINNDGIWMHIRNQLAKQLNVEPETIKKDDSRLKEYEQKYVDQIKFKLIDKVNGIMTTNYFETDTYYSDNREIFDYAAFTKDQAYQEVYGNFNLRNDINLIITAVTTPPATLSIKGGDDNE